MYDVIIIGRGPAGISASLYTSRANLRTLVISKDWGNLEKAGEIHNYYGTNPGSTGMDILENGIDQAKSFGVEFIEDEIVGLDTLDAIDVVGLAGRYKSRVLILAMGSPKRKPAFDNISKFEGNGVSYCVACDGFFYKDRKTAVIGYNEFMVHEVTELSNITKKITVFTNGMPLDVSDVHMAEISDYSIVTDEIKGFFGDEVLEGIELKSGDKKVFDGVFIAYGSASCTELAIKAGILTEKGVIIIDRDMQTNIPGIFAAGDCTGGLRQVSAAVGNGAEAARAAMRYLKTASK
ncbi:MAG: NAD(P)/FAD-dependent oxidoreductase [Clostridia bacterium]|nr:NAD(P)/FAD-dependent oxidoreductase [Clostridia bacterium]MBN2883469.1 NAD(P)/FAD-dependent oxidoreductase [Clostridia bacterium]